MSWRTITPKGIKVWAPSDARRLVIGNKVITLPFRATQLHANDVGNDVVVVAVSGEDRSEDAAAAGTWRIKGSTGEAIKIAPYRALGMQPCKVASNGGIAFISSTRSVWWWLPPDGPMSWRDTAFYENVGIDNLTLINNEPVITLLSAARKSLGHTIVRYRMETSSWEVGIEPPLDRIIARRKSDGLMKIVTAVKSPVPPSIAETAGGDLLVAQNLIDDSERWFFSSANFIPYSIPPAPALPLPRQIPVVHRVVDMLGAPAPGSFQWGITGRDVPTLEGMPYAAHISPAETVGAILFSSDPNGARDGLGVRVYTSKRQEFDACINEVITRNDYQTMPCVLALYCDSATRFSAEMLEWVGIAEHEVPVLLLIKGYPVAGDDVDTLFFRVLTEMTRLYDRGWNIGLMLPAYLGNNSWERKLVEDWILSVDDSLLPEAREEWGIETKLLAYFGAKRPDGLSSVIEYVRRVEERSVGVRPWISLVGHPPPPLPQPPTDPPSSPSPSEEPPVIRKKIVALRRNFDTPLYLAVNDHRTEVTAVHDISDAAKFELFVFDQPGSGARAGEFAPGQKVLLRSIQDQVCLYSYPSDSPYLRTTLNIAGLWEIRQGEFPNTWDFLVPVVERAITVFQNGDVAVRAYKSAVMWSQHGFELIDIETGKVIEGTF
jgi:hypothetical protein